MTTDDSLYSNVLCTIIPNQTSSFRVLSCLVLLNVSNVFFYIYNDQFPFMIQYQPKEYISLT